MFIYIFNITNSNMHTPCRRMMDGYSLLNIISYGGSIITTIRFIVEIIYNMFGYITIIYYTCAINNTNSNEKTIRRYIS